MDHTIKHMRELTQKLLVYQQSGMCCDVILQCSNGGVWAHSVVLMSSCLTMQYKLQTNNTSLYMSLHNSPSQLNRITLSMVQYPMHLVQSLISYLYTGVMEKPKEKETVLFNQLLDEYGLMPHFAPTFDNERLDKVCKVQNQISKDEAREKKLTKEVLSLPEETATSFSASHDHKEHTEQFDINNEIKVEMDTDYATEDNSVNDFDIDDTNMGNIAHDEDTDLNDGMNVSGDEEVLKNAYSKPDMDEESTEQMPVVEKFSDNVFAPNEGHDEAVQSIEMREKLGDDYNLYLLNLARQSPTRAQPTNEPSGSNMHTCSDCKKSFDSYSELIQHIRETENDFAHPVMVKEKKSKLFCVICNQKFSRKKHLDEHKKTHTGNEVVASCPICGKTFTCKTKGTLKGHMRVHATEKDYFECDKCDKTFKWKEGLKAHLEKHEQDKEATFTCEECGEAFAFQRVLNVHRRRKHPATLHTCDVCGKSFPYAHELKYHQRIHTGERRYPCDWCGKRFHQSGGLATHVKAVHKGIRPFSCDVCQLTFPARSTLKIHMRTHTGEKPYSCAVCLKCFTRADDCKKHMRNVHK